MATASANEKETELDRRRLRHESARAATRIVAGLVGILGAYALMPLGTDQVHLVWLPLAIAGLVLFVWVFIRQLRKIETADFPVLRAAEALVLVLGLFLTLFAAAAVALEQATHGSFNESLTRIDGFYYAVTTLATVGFGDIHPVSQPARILGIVQMLGNLMLLGVAVRLVGRAVDRGRDS